MADPFVGEVRLVPFTFAPVGWAFCNGQIMAITDNEALFALIGTIYGGDGQTTFGLPDLRGRVPIHEGQFTTIGQVFGTESTTLTTGQMPTHGHQLHVSSGTGTSFVPLAHYLGGSAKTNTYGNSGDVAMTPSSATGGNQPHENRQPYLVLNYIIALFGIFPTPN